MEMIDLIKCYDNFQSDVNELLKREPFLFDDKTNYSKYIDRNCSKAIILEDETFLVWPNYNHAKKSAWLTVFNITLKKIEIIIPIGDSLITIVSTYPYEKRLDSLKWLLLWR